MTPPDPRAVRKWWGWLRHIKRSGEPYMDRYSLRQQSVSGHNPWRVYLNHFLAADNPGHHNHPSKWSFSIVLWGSYTEEVLETDGHPTPSGVWSLWSTRVTTRRVRWFNWIPASRYHRIVELHPGPGAKGVWTLFFAGPLTGRGWGFWRPGIGHVPYTPEDVR